MLYIRSAVVSPPVLEELKFVSRFSPGSTFAERQLVQFLAKRVWCPKFVKHFDTV